MSFLHNNVDVLVGMRRLSRVSVTIGSGIRPWGVGEGTY